MEHKNKVTPLKLVDSFNELFWNWVIYVWKPDAEELEDCESGDYPEPDKTIAEQFLERENPDLEEMERVAVSKTNRAPFSFFEVVRVYSQSFEAMDMFYDRTCRIWDSTLSQQIDTGDIIYANPVEIGDCAFLPSLSPIKLGPESKDLILSVGDTLRDTYGEDFKYYDRAVDDELRKLFLSIYFKTMGMADDAEDDEEGDIFLRRTFYDIQSPEAAFEALYPLAHASKEKLYSTAIFSENGQMKWVGVPCFMGADTSEELEVESFLGNIVIRGQVLEVETTSEEREEILRMEVEERIGDQAVFRTTEIEEIEPESPEYEDLEWEEE
jgi:hypothetical protein